MIRKQLYLEEAQDRALKALGKELGISEAEFVQRALNAALYSRSTLVAPRRAALTRLLDNAKRLSEAHRLKDYRFDRDELYGARQGRWLKHN